MDDIRRQDTRLFVRELLNPGRLLLTFAVCVLAFSSPLEVIPKLFAAILILFVSGTYSWFESVRHRWLDKRIKSLWEGCSDRLRRFNDVQEKMRKSQVADLSEMPATIHGVASTLYLALRRADMIAHEVQMSEKGLYASAPVWTSPSRDAQSKELYRLADKNIAEYRQQFAGVMAGVQRTEAQAAVFMTTVDTLRMKMIGYRLVGHSPEMANSEFLSALAEARAQLQSIDTALEELDMGHYPKTISVVPPPIPEDVVLRQRIGDDQGNA